MKFELRVDAKKSWEQDNRLRAFLNAVEDDIDKEYVFWRRLVKDSAQTSSMEPYPIDDWVSAMHDLGSIKEFPYDEEPKIGMLDRAFSAMEP